MIYHVKLYIFVDIQLLIFIIAFKNRVVKIKKYGCCSVMLRQPFVL